MFPGNKTGTDFRICFGRVDRTAAELGLDGPGARLHTAQIAEIESPEVMLNSFLSASSSRLDPC